METSSLTIMPMSQEITLVPGETYTGSITVANPDASTSDLSYTASIAPYGVKGSGYDVDLFSETSRTEMVHWLTIDNASGTLAPNDTAEIHFSIKVPSDAAPGGQYAVIKVAQKDPSSQENDLSVNNIYEAASIIYGNVTGEVIREGTVTGQFIPNFITTPEFTSTATIENHGTTHEDAIVTFTITNVFNGSTIYPHDSSDKGINEIIMPDTTRELSYDFKDMPVIGVINVTQTIEYNGETYTNAQNIFICPAWFMVIVATLLLSTIGLIIMHVKKSRRRKHNASI